MILEKPTTPFIRNQPFGANYNSYYKEGGLKGHSGTDLGCEYKQEIHSACDGYVYSVLNLNNPDLTRYRAVYVLVDDDKDDTMAYEVSYGHLMDILVKTGDYVKAGQVIGTAGNTGNVFVGGVEVTREEKNAGSTKGTHLHFQVRELYKNKAYQYKDNYPIFDGTDLLKKNDFFYFVRDFTNGYNGCVDPEQFFEEYKWNFKVNLQLGDRNTDVTFLQQALKKFGFFTYPKSTGFYGKITRKAVLDFQLAYKVIKYPYQSGWGYYFGPKTRSKLNEIQ